MGSVISGIRGVLQYRDGLIPNNTVSALSSIILDLSISDGGREGQERPK